jgi:hypothetical protein
MITGCISVPQWLIELLENQTLLNAAGAALGGFFGVIAFFFVRFGIETWLARPKFLRSYSCAHDQNVGNKIEYEGQLMHHHGQRVTDKTELKKIGKNAPVWEWKRDTCGRDPQGATVIYGPYTTDFSEPGEYEVSFSVRAIGIPKESELSNDPIILEFDVARTSHQLVPTSTQSGFIRVSTDITVSRHFVRASDLARGRWTDIPLRFYATGEGVWEYRVLAYDGVSKSPDNIRHFEQNIRLFFDMVTIRRIRKMRLPWG